MIKHIVAVCICWFAT